MKYYIPAILLATLALTACSGKSENEKLISGNYLKSCVESAQRNSNGKLSSKEAKKLCRCTYDKSRSQFKDEASWHQAIIDFEKNQDSLSYTVATRTAANNAKKAAFGVIFVTGLLICSHKPT